MPELPEVETIARSLRNPIEYPFHAENKIGTRPGIVSRRITGALVTWSRSVALSDTAEFEKRVQNRVVQAVERRGKFLVLALDTGWILIHLRMSGDIRVEPGNADGLRPHDRVAICFEHRVRLVFNDTRKFGRVWLVKDPQTVLGNLGPEPLAEEFTHSIFYDKLHSRNRLLKPLLMDQQFLAGMGNIYTDEALHLAGLHPLRHSGSLSRTEVEKLHRAIRDVLQEGIHRNGASIDWVYRGGNFQNYFKVYQKQGEPCQTCGTAIERMLVGQRGTHFCPKCQPLL